MVAFKVAKYIGSAIARKVLKNRPDLHKKFDDIMKNEVDVTSSVKSQTSQALNILRSDKVKSGLNVTKKSIGGEIELKKGSEYIKDLL
jgi:uncharacterized protein YajQ (UPF0234 family)